MRRQGLPLYVQLNDCLIEFLNVCQLEFQASGLPQAKALLL